MWKKEIKKVDSEEKIFSYIELNTKPSLPRIDSFKSKDDLDDTLNTSSIDLK